MRHVLACALAALIAAPVMSRAASETTTVLYTGPGTPAPVSGTFDADDDSVQWLGSGGIDEPCPAQVNGVPLRYDVVTVENTTQSTAHVVIDLQCPATGNINAVVYSPTFDPSQPLQNCVRYSDGCTMFQPIDVAAGASISISLMPEAGAQVPRPWSISFDGTTPVTLQSFEVD